MKLDRLPRDWQSREGAGLAAGVLLGFLCRTAIERLLRRFGLGGAIPSALLYDSDEEDSSLGAAHGEHKLVLCVRTDLKMQKGKIAAQVGHATLGAYKSAARKCPAVLRAWERNAQPKIALQIRSRAEATQLESAARRKGLVTYVVHDAGRTQIAAGSMTVLAVGPGPAHVVSDVTGHLKLL